MCNYTEAEDSLVSLRGKGVLVVAPRMDAVRGVVESLEAEGAHVLVASAQACELPQVLAGGRGLASPRVACGLVRGLTVDLSRHSEIVRAFRWVDGMLPRLDALVSVVDIGGEGGLEKGTRGGSRDFYTDGDLEGWHRKMEAEWLMPLELMLEAASRMRLRGSGHLLQIGVWSGRRGRETEHRCAASFDSSAEDTDAASAVEEMGWTMLCKMLDARRAHLAGCGIRLTLMEVMCGGGLRGGIPRALGEGGRVAGRSDEVRSAAALCLHAPGSLTVEYLRVNGGSGGLDGIHGGGV